MAETDTHGNDCDKSLQVVAQDMISAIDNTEGAVPASAPSRRHCGVRIVGHGVETGGWMVYGDRGTGAPSVTETA